MLVTDETKRRVTASIRSANLTPGMPSGNGQSHRGAAAALLELHQKIDRSYKIEVGPLCV
jgi:hypothetical protein